MAARTQAQKAWTLKNKAKLRIQQKQYYEHHRDKILEQSKKYAKANPDKVFAVHRKCYLNNVEKYNSKVKRWEKANPEKRNAICKRWRDKNPALVNAFRMLYTARKKNATIGDQVAVKAIYKIATSKLSIPCAYCWKKTTAKLNRQVEHVIPLSRGGYHDAENLAIVCVDCNKSKGNKLVSEWNRPL